ncbi:MAG: (2Fe-2S)-binding protein [Candidatus Cloacimonetes bacterium]|nr:(2Fe-2S)-binding protein [Candidatus Cloacimonadota bacterium]
MTDLKFKLNGQETRLSVPDNLRLLDILRDVLGLTGTKEGCGIGECGACTVLLNQEAVCSCLVLASQIQGCEVETIENVDQDEILIRIKDAFLKRGAIQCGFCTPGMIMSAKALLLKNPHPSEEEIREALAGNLCRCTGYIPIIQAVQQAAES